MLSGAACNLRNPVGVSLTVATSWRARTALNAYLDVPYIQQVFVLERTTTIGKTGQVRQETVVGVTRRPSDKASPKDLLGRCAAALDD